MLFVLPTRHIPDTTLATRARDKNTTASDKNTTEEGCISLVKPGYLEIKEPDTHLLIVYISHASNNWELHEVIFTQINNSGHYPDSLIWVKKYELCHAIYVDTSYDVDFKKSVQQ